VRSESRGQAPDKCVAWWYAPPSDHTSDGRFVLLHTKSGAQAPLTHWRPYKPKEVFTQNHAWELFFNMMAAGYVPFPGTSLPQLSSITKKNGPKLESRSGIANMDGEVSREKEEAYTAADHHKR